MNGSRAKWVPVGAMATAILVSGAIDYLIDGRLTLGKYGALFVGACLLAATLIAVLRPRGDSKIK